MRMSNPQFSREICDGSGSPLLATDVLEKRQRPFIECCIESSGVGQKDVHSKSATGEAFFEGYRRVHAARAWRCDVLYAVSGLGDHPARLGNTRGGVRLGAPAARPSEGAGRAPARFGFPSD